MTLVNLDNKTAKSMCRKCDLVEARSSVELTVFVTDRYKMSCIVNLILRNLFLPLTKPLHLVETFYMYSFPASSTICPRARNINFYTTFKLAPNFKLYSALPCIDKPCGPTIHLHYKCSYVPDSIAYFDVTTNQ